MKSQFNFNICQSTLPDTLANLLDLQVITFPFKYNTLYNKIDLVRVLSVLNIIGKVSGKEVLQW